MLLFCSRKLQGACASTQAAVDKLPLPAEVFSALQRAFLCLADPAVADSSVAGAFSVSGGSGATGGGSGTAAVAAALGRSAEADRLTIARALAAVYSAHADAIGESLRRCHLGPSVLFACHQIVGFAVGQHSRLQDHLGITRVRA